MILMYEKISKKNIDKAALIQYKIFPNSCCYSVYLANLENDNELPINYLVYYNDNPIGVIGLYFMEKYVDTLWLSWFGVFEEYRFKGFGSQMFNDIIEKAKIFNKKFLRLYTYEVWNSESQHFYNKYMQISEYYTNEKDNQYDILNGKCKIFGYSLCDEKVDYWNNKFIDIGSEDDVHNKSIQMMKRDKLI